MEGRGRSRARKKRFFSPKRLTSFLLAAAMVFTNVGADLSTAFAADSTDVSFEMRGADLVAAIEDAVASENVVAPDDLNFTNGNVEKFEDFLFGDGKLYELLDERNRLRAELEGAIKRKDMAAADRLNKDIREISRIIYRSDLGGEDGQ